jgi:hypothetical protein
MATATNKSRDLLSQEEQVRGNEEDLLTDLLAMHLLAGSYQIVSELERLMLLKSDLPFAGLLNASVALRVLEADA